MTPIEKNVIVVDEFGNKYEATYPKRAKGLVKNGRARFINENKICLLCLPNMKAKDNNMSENKKVDTVNNISTNNEISKNISNNTTIDSINTESKQQPLDMTVAYLLDKLEVISTNYDYVNDAISELSKIKSDGQGDLGVSEQAKAFCEIVKARETTNQRLISLYEKIYDDLKSDETQLKEMALKLLENVSDDIQKVSVFSDALDAIRHLG